jgi:tRNA pseudouridine38-40 synthase
MPTWKLTIAWDGRAYVGWQRQPNEHSVQGVLEAALSSVFGGSPVLAIASGRTDAGVHAMAQIVSFVAKEARSAHQVVAGVNAHLPMDVAVLAAEVAPDDFHARTWTQEKTYRYRILPGRPRCPHRDGHVWHMRHELDLSAMAEAASAVVGKHDMRSFRAQGCASSHPVRRIVSARVSEADDEVHLEFVGHGFLRHQVRIMVGTLSEIGLGRRPVEGMAEALAARERLAAGPTAPAHGLWLMAVVMGDHAHPRDD